MEYILRLILPPEKIYDYLLDRRYFTGSSTQLGSGARRPSDCHGGPKS